MSARTVAVTGATGNVGGAVLERLAVEPSVEVVAIARDAGRVRRPDVEVRVADYDDRPAMTAALAGVQTLVFVSSDGQAAAMLHHHLTVLDAASQAGVQHVVYLSIVDIAPESPFCYAEVHRITEQRLRELGVAHTVVRAGMYTEFFGGWITRAATTGELSLPMGDGRLSLVSREDVAGCLARVAAAGPAPTHTAPCELTGSRLYGLDDLAEVAAGLGGRAVRAAPTTLEDFGALLLREQTGPWWTYAFTSMFTSVGEHRFEPLTDHVHELLGRPPRRPEEVLARGH